MDNRKHIMVDLETLSSASNAVVVSIGAVIFDPKTGELGERFYVEMTDDLDAQQLAGRDVSASTFKWWMEQNAQAKQVFAKTPAEGVRRTSTVEALHSFANFIDVHAGGEKNAVLWGNGAVFDNVVLRSLYASAGFKAPWSYRNDACYRTLKNLPGAPAMQQEFGVAHNALDDAICQALHAVEIFAWLGRP